MNVVARISRLVVIEWIKLRSQLLFYLAIVLIVATTLLAAGSQVHGNADTHTLRIFATGAEYGLWMTSLFIVIFGTLIFSSEFDRGTMKNILTRPVTRTDVYLAKCITVLLLTIGFALLAFYVSLLYGSIQGQMGSVWAETSSYTILKTPEEVVKQAWKAVEIALPSLLATMFFGLMISCFFDSTGVAVAVALILFLLSGLVTEFIGNSSHLSFRYYPSHAMKVLQQITDGVSLKWNETVERWFSIVPLIYTGVFAILSYLRFRMRDVSG